MSSKSPEAKFWEDIRNDIAALGDYDRIESHDTSIGRPDLNLCLPGGINWDIELKCAKNGTIRIRPSQRGWFKRRHRVGAKIAVLTKVPVSGCPPYFLLNLAPLPRGTRAVEWADQAKFYWPGIINWKQLEEFLRNG